MAAPAYKAEPEAVDAKRPRVLSVQTTSSNTKREAANDNYRRNIAAVNDNDPKKKPRGSDKRNFLKRRTQAEAEEISMFDGGAERVRAIRGAAQLANAGAVTGTERVAGLKRKVKAVQASWVLVAILMPFYPLQLLFGFLQGAGYGAERIGESFFWGIGASLVPGEWIFAFAWVFVLLFGFITMFTAVFIYTARTVPWWRGYGIPMLILMMVFYFIPILNLFPWVLVWMISVVYAQK